MLAHNYYTKLPLRGPGHVPIHEQSLAEGYLLTWQGVGAFGDGCEPFCLTIKQTIS